MVYFNNQLINTYDLDSVNTIINRLAAKNQTVSEYLYFEDGNPDINKILENEKIVFVNLLPIMQKENFQNIYDKFKDIFTIQKIIEGYVLLNKELDDLYEKEKEYPEYKNMFIESSLLFIIDYINKKDEDFILNKKEINNIWENRYTLKKNFEKMINDNIKNVEKIEKTYEYFSRLKGILYTDFEIEKFKFLLELNINDISLMEIFNNIKLNKNIPFATTHYFYKIMKNFIPYTKWVNLFDRSKTPFDKYKNINRLNNIILKVLQKTKNTNYKDFTEIILNIENEMKIVKIKFEYNIKQFDISQEELKNRVLNIINLHDIKNEKIIEVNGIFYFPNQTMNKYVISDLIMNDPLFSSILVLDETTITAKSNIYIYFNNPIIGKVTAYLTEQVVLKTNCLAKKKELFPIGSKYIRVKISSCENEKKVKDFQKILSKLFILYNKNYENIIEFYRNNSIDIETEYENIKNVDLKNIENFAKDRFKNKDKIFQELKEIDPYIFRTIYSRYCRRLPIPISDEDEKNPEIINYIDKNGNSKKYDVITFPKEQINDSNPQKYICNYEKDINPGLRDNPYDNSDILPYIPCCYVRKQIGKTGSKYMNYYFGQKLKKQKEKTKGNIYTSNIILKNNDFGTLPENIERIFSLADLTANYYRKGVFRNKNSFLNCILEAMNEDTNILEFIYEDDREYELKKIRTELGTDVYATACKQEMYDYTIEEIQNKIKNNDEYFDPQLFIHLLELKYNCNIFLFKRNNQGSIILPRHTKGYYKNINNNKCIFIFEHIGSLSEKNEYPQCELIVRQIENSEDTEYNFDYKNNISQNIFNFFENINNYYIFNKKIDLIDYNLINSPIIKIVSQIIDNYGKTRALNIIYKNKNITLFTSPIQPIILNINNTNNIYKSKIDIIFELANKLGIIINKQVIINDSVIQLVGFLGNIEITIPVDDENKIEGIPIEKNINININENNSVLFEYNRYKKLARYIIEYIYWLYSKFLYENKIGVENISNESNLENFYENYIKIDKNFIYSHVNKSFSMKSGVMENDKLIIKSEETLKRLFFVLKMFAIRNYQKLFNYHNKKVIENYYLEISDFDNYTFQIILEGEDSINKWINEKNENNNIMNDDIIPDNTNAYFFRNPNIEKNKIFIAQNAENIIIAVNIAINWYEYNYNIGNKSGFEEQLENPSFTLYSYINNKKNKVYKVLGEEKDYDIKIIGYKINDISKFTVLLDVI